MDAMTPTTARADETTLRVELAAAFRLIARLDWHEAVANHFSAAVSADGRQFLLNPRWMHFSRIRASDLLLLDVDAEPDAALLESVDSTAWAIHGAMHANVPQARCILHIHPPYATAIGCLADPRLLPIDQTTARYFNRIAYDVAYAGIASEFSEGERLARVLGDKRVMMMGNHGVLVAGDSVAEAFDALYYLERGCRTLALAYATGQKLSVLSDEVAERTARGQEAEPAFADAHFAEMRRILDREDPSYAD